MARYDSHPETLMCDKSEVRTTRGTCIAVRYVHYKKIISELKPRKDIRTSDEIGQTQRQGGNFNRLFTRHKSSGQGHNLNGSNQERKRSVHIERRRLHHNQSIHGGKKRGWEHYVFTSNFWVVFHLLLNMFLSPQWK